MTIKVTQEHIDKGEPQDDCGCPIALAIKEQAIADISVGTVYVYFDNKETMLPDKATQFIIAFDQGRPVSPFEFELPITTED